MPANLNMRRKIANILHLLPAPVKWSVILTCLIPFVQGCNTARFLHPEKGETLLVANKIEFVTEGKEKVKGKSFLLEQLSQRLQQRPNRKFFGVPRPYFYFISLDSTDKSKTGLASDRTMRRKLGEKPVFIDTSLAAKTVELMTTFMQNKGYFQTEVYYKVTTNKDSTKATVTYLIKPKGRYTIDTLIYQSKDTAILQILLETADASFLKPGAPIDIDLYKKEVSRITNYLINNGYAKFYPQYINNLEAFDSSNTALNAKLILEVLTPSGKDKHEKFHFGNVYVYQDLLPGQQGWPPPDTLINGIYFASGGKQFKVKRKTIANIIHIKTGALYRLEDVEATRRRIASLGIYSAPNVKSLENSGNPDILDYHIQLASNKKWEMEVGGGLSYTERNGPGFSSNLIGLTFSPSVRNRNMFRGAELLAAGVDMGAELAPLSPDSILNSTDLRVQTDLIFPRFVEFPKVWSGLSNLIDNRQLYDKLKENGRSRISASYNWISLINNYQLNFFNLSFGHQVRLSATKRLSANQAGVELLIPNIVEGSVFAELLENQPFLQRSFSKQFMSGFLFRDLTFIYDQSILGGNSYWYFRGHFDLS
ncbi:MAG TPA: hypothetical protein ENJ20_07230, partial [Bacteroidetes bacterium]|nr:hypothetical protein [Bacteroidota bacterium]